jgi:beta-galactosidase/beta-glucuronidase
MHVIRLHGPWEYEPLTGVGEDVPPSGRLTIPADWSETLGADFRGRVRYTRRFHRPTGLIEGQRVWLAVERVEATGAVSLNGQMLGPAAAKGGPFRFDVTDLLARYNVLTIDAESFDRPGGVTGFVRLEIEEPKEDLTALNPLL